MCTTSARSAAARISVRRRTCWTPGSRPHCGRSPRSAGRTRPRSSTISTRPATLVTGYDIIFFWVARMIFSGVEHMGEAPFKTVLYPRSGARRAGPQDVQVARQRHRPAGGHRPVRRGCAALHARDRQQPRKRYAFLGRAASRRPETSATRSGTHPALSR